MNEFQQSFADFIFATNADGSGKAASYIRALDMLGPILTKHCPHFGVNGSMWHEFPLATLTSIHAWLCAESRKGNASAALSDFESPSYFRNNFCSAAVQQYREFMAVEKFESVLLEGIEDETTGAAVSQHLGRSILKFGDNALKPFVAAKGQKGLERLASVKQRLNQDVFRRMVLANYRGKCALTGLAVPEVLRASHISPWADDETNRLNPENGICLSATYDAAFDRHLISFDEDYRMIIAPSAKDYYTDTAFVDWFLKREGQQLSLPLQFGPSRALLMKHREQLA